MLKKAAAGLFLLTAMTGLFGCATAARRPEVKSSETPAPVVADDNSAEIQKMKQQLADQQAALAQSEADKKALEDKLDNALASKTPASKKTENSYLK